MVSNLSLLNSPKSHPQLILTTSHTSSHPHSKTASINIKKPPSSQLAPNPSGMWNAKPPLTSIALTAHERTGRPSRKWLSSQKRHILTQKSKKLPARTTDPGISCREPKTDTSLQVKTSVLMVKHATHLMNCGMASTPPTTPHKIAP
jgi:hypothetical protein